MQGSNCDCQKSEKLIFFCVENDCSLSRRLCIYCKQQHFNHSMRQLKKSDSLKELFMNENNPQKSAIIKCLYVARNTINHLKQKLLDEINIIIKDWDTLFQKYLIKPLQIIKNTTSSQYQTQVRIIIQDKASSKERLNEIAQQIRSLGNADFKQKKKIEQICQNTVYILADVLIDIRKQLQVSNQKLKTKLEELYPFTANKQEINKQLQNSKAKIKKQIKVYQQSFVNIKQFNQEVQHQNQIQKVIPFYQQSLLNIQESPTKPKYRRDQSKPYAIITQKKNKYYFNVPKQ